MIRLSLRLQLLLDLSLPGQPLWDLCCDHGLLGLRALEVGFPEVHFVDRVPHLIAKLQMENTFDERAFFYALPAEEVSSAVHGTVVIAGVGGEKTLTILQSLNARGILLAKRLVLAPQKDERDFEESFPSLLSEWKFLEIHEVREGLRVRRVWVAERMV